jgi:cell division protein FtsA
MKIQFGSALPDQAKANAFITIPGLRGMPTREISVKNLAAIINARMSEILDFVSYQLKQVGMDHHELNGGIILTGGGSQLKHLIQLTEYITGLNARVGLPNEHLAANHIDELKKPMYATCIGLILKGYNDFENKHKEFNTTFAKINVPVNLTKKTKAQDVPQPEPVSGPSTVPVKAPRRGIWDNFKNGLIDIFKEDADQILR